MARVYKRRSDKARGKAGRYTCLYKDEGGRTRSVVGFTDKAESLRYAQELEKKATLVRDGLVDPKRDERLKAGRRPVAGHVDDYRRALLAKGDTAKHATRTANALTRLLADARIDSAAGIAPDRVQEALGRLKASASARTCNFFLGAIRAFAVWLERSERIERAPPGLAAIPRFNEEADRRLIRRVITKAEIDRLLAAAEAGNPVEAERGPRSQTVAEKGSPRYITGPERAILYRLAMSTGFRASELRSLTAESFSLGGDEPTVTVAAAYTKNGKAAVQPITREMAAGLKPLLDGRSSADRFVVVPVRTAKLLRVDLAAASIPYQDERGRVLDFHALRHSYISHLVASGVSPKIVQVLARHSSITLTLDRYTSLDAGDIRRAIERGGSGAEGG